MAKKYRRIGEIAKELGITNSTIRYWEEEFSQLKPKKNKSGHRKYTHKEFEIIKMILYYRNEGFTIKGTIKKLEKAMPTGISKGFHEDMLVLTNNLRALIDDL